MVKEKLLNINEEGCSIRCKLYMNDPRTLKQIVLFGHGFGGHKENRAAERFAEKYLSKQKNAAVFTFDWPCHGEDGRKRLTLEDCDLYIRLLLSYIEEQYHPEKVFVYATSFGGYLFLKYIREHGMTFSRMALRCPAVRMYDAVMNGIMTGEEHEKLRKGKPVLIGFDRKIKVDEEFLEQLREADITKWDFTDFADDVLLIHGTKDEVIPIDTVRQFSEDNIIELIEAGNADHRFSDPKIMDKAIHDIICFFEG